MQKFAYLAQKLDNHKHHLKKMIKYSKKDKLGRGAEGVVYKSLDGKWVVKEHRPLELETQFLNKKISLPLLDWQSDWEGFYETCLLAHKSSGIPFIKSHFTNQIICIQEDGSESPSKNKKLICPFIENLPSQRLTLKKIRDPHLGPQILAELLKLIQKAYFIRKKYELGYDPFGFEALTTSLKIFFQNGLKSFVKTPIVPSSLEKQLIKSLSDTELSLSNILLIDQNNYQELKGKFEGIPQSHDFESNPQKVFLACIDIGMHDFSSKGKKQILTKLANQITFASLIEILKKENQRLPSQSQLPKSKLDELSKYYLGPKVYRDLASMLSSFILG